MLKVVGPKALEEAEESLDEDDEDDDDDDEEEEEDDDDDDDDDDLPKSCKVFSSKVPSKFLDSLESFD